jgi:hypothetical protein
VSKVRAPGITPAEIDRALLAAIADPDNWERNVTYVFDDFWRGRAAVYRIGAIAIPAISSRAFDRLRVPSKSIRLHPSLLAAVGALPVVFGRIPNMGELLILAGQIADELTSAEPSQGTGDNVISFPSFRRLEQMWDASDDYSTFPDGPSAA